MVRTGSLFVCSGVLSALALTGTVAARLGYQLTAGYWLLLVLLSGVAVTLRQLPAMLRCLAWWACDRGEVPWRSQHAAPGSTTRSTIRR